MKIKSIKTFAIDCFRTNWVFVKVLTDEGIPDTMRALADVRARVKVPIACGERLYTTQQILDAIELRAMERSGEVHALRYDAATGAFTVLATLPGLYRPVALLKERGGES